MDIARESCTDSFYTEGQVGFHAMLDYVHLSPNLHIHYVQTSTSIFYRTQVSLGSDLWVRLSLTMYVCMRGFADLNDVTLADGDTKSILTDNANRAIQGNVAMYVTLQSTW